MNKTVFIASSTFAQEDQKPLMMLEQRGLRVIRNITGRRLSGSELVEMGQGAVASIAGLEKYDKDVFSRWSDLRCISRCGVGVDTIDLIEAEKRSIAVFNTPDAVVTPVAEMTVAMILDLLRRISFHSAKMHAGFWERTIGDQLSGKTVGVIGLGRIGRRVAELLKRLDADVIGFDISPDPSWAEKQMIRLVNLEDLIRLAGVITLHTSSLPQQPFLLSQEQISKMSKGVMIVNLARGNCLDEKALIEGLKDGRVAGAAIDVFAQEPYQGELRNFPNVILTPHIATFTTQARVQMEVRAVEQVLCYLESV